MCEDTRCSKAKAYQLVFIFQGLIGYFANSKTNGGIIMKTMLNKNASMRSPDISGDETELI